MVLTCQSAATTHQTVSSASFLDFKIEGTAKCKWACIADKAINNWEDQEIQILSTIKGQI